jgi:hypothetical protein
VLKQLYDELRDDFDAWTDSREDWIARGLLLAYLAYGLVRHIADPMYKTWFGGITLAFHEMGHIAFIPFGHTLTVAGGSIMQLLVPTAASVYLLKKQDDWFGFALGMAWLSFSMFELATYIGDAARMELPLVGFGGGYHHDWSTLLTQWRLIDHCDGIALGVRIAAGLVGLVSISLGSIIVWRVARRRLTARAECYLSVLVRTATYVLLAALTLIGCTRVGGSLVVGDRTLRPVGCASNEITGVDGFALALRDEEGRLWFARASASDQAFQLYRPDPTSVDLVEAQCSTFDVEFARDMAQVHHLHLVGGHASVRCTLPDGLDVTGTVTFHSCSGQR